MTARRMPNTACAFDLTNGGGLFRFRGHTDVKELALYVQDTITKGNWSFNLGIRGDLYNGLTEAQQAEPRLGIAYNIKPSNTVLRVSYARTLETPFNENLVLSSIGCANPVLNPLLACSSSALTPLIPAFAMNFTPGLQQAFGKHVVFDGEYIWKYTHNGYDFSILGNTPITFPVEWHNSKIPGFTGRVNLTNLHGFTAYVVMSSVAARFFTPQIGGAGAVPSAIGPFPHRPRRKIQPDHAPPISAVEARSVVRLQLALRQRTRGRSCDLRRRQLQQRTGRQRHDGGRFHPQPGPAIPGRPLLRIVPSSSHLRRRIPQERHSPRRLALTSALRAMYGSSLLKIPAPGTEDDDHNPPRVAPRNLFDLSVGDDNLFHGDKYKWSRALHRHQRQRTSYASTTSSQPSAARTTSRHAQ